MEIEKRILPMNLRARKTGAIEGYAAVFNSNSEDLGFIEKIKPGAFDGALKRSKDVVALKNHNPDLLFGRQGVNLTLDADTHGLYMAVEPIDTPIFKSVQADIRAGVLKSQSFAFTVKADTWTDTDTDTPKRTITEIGEIYDVSVVSNPAYPETTAALRSLSAARGDNTMSTENYAAQAVARGIQLPEPESIELIHDEADKRQYERPGDFYRDVMRAGMPSRQISRQLANVQKRATGLSEGVPSDGGFLVAPEFSKDIMKSLFTGNPILKMVKRYNIKSNAIKIPAVDETSRADGSRHGGVQAYYIAEAGEKTASKPKFRQMELSLNKLVVLVYATDELLEDAGALGAYLGEIAPDEIGFKTQDAIINGSGAGQPLGIVNSGGLVSVSKESGQAADTVVFENIVKMYQRMPGRNRANAVWVCNQDVEAQLFTMSLSVGTGGSTVFLPAGGASAAPFATLMGRPLIPIEQCPTLGDAGDIMFCDFSQYIMATRGNVQADMSVHVRFIYDESVFRYVFRLDGQPALSSPITPFNGTATLSPFVALAERT